MEYYRWNVEKCYYVADHKNNDVIVKKWLGSPHWNPVEYKTEAAAQQVHDRILAEGYPAQDIRVRRIIVMELE